MRKGYFYVNGKLLKKDSRVKDDYILNLDYKYNYEVYNFGVSKNFDKCKYFALNDVITDTKGNRKIIPNTYICIFEIELSSKDYKTIDDDSLLAEFDILKKIKESDKKIIYSGMFDEQENYIENFITCK